MDHERVRGLVQQLYATLSELEEMFPGRHFTPDGHMVGSLGECLVADAYGLTFMSASNKGLYAVTPDGRKVEIKATQAQRVAFRHKPAFVVVVKINKDGTFDEIYSGPGGPVWQHFAGKSLPSNGQYQISINRLRELNQSVPARQRIVCEVI
jgi:hypothetical protein